MKDEKSCICVCFAVFSDAFRAEERGLKNRLAPNVDIIIKSYEETFLKEEPSAKLTILEKNDRAKNIWALFKIEAPSISKKSNLEAQLVYVIQGEDDIHNVFVMIKEKTLSQKFVQKWSKVFKEGKLINE